MKKTKDDTRIQVAVYFQMQNPESKMYYSRLKKISDYTGLSMSAIMAIGVRMAMTDLETALVEKSTVRNFAEHVGNEQEKIVRKVKNAS